MGRRERWYSKINKVLNPGSKLRINPKAKKSSSQRVGNHSHQLVPLPQVEDVVFIEPAGLSELAPKMAIGITQPNTVSRYAEKSKEDAAAILIQTAYRGYLGRRTLRALRGLVRLKFLVQGHAVKGKATNTLQCMQALARIQSQVRSRRALMSKGSGALQKQLLQKSAKKHTAFRNSEDWKDCSQSKEQEEAKLKKKHEAALRRERTLAYSSSVHQQTWKSSPKRRSTTVMDSDNPSWGWSWLERWMQNATNEGSPDSSLKMAQGEATREAQIPPPTIKTVPKSPPPNPALKLPSMIVNHKPASARMRLSNVSGSDISEKYRRQSFAGSSLESSAGSNSPRSQTMPAKSPNTRQRLQSPLGIEHKSSAVRPAEKPPSHLASHNNPRRHSAPPKVRNTTVTQQNQNITAEIS